MGVICRGTKFSRFGRQSANSSSKVLRNCIKWTPNAANNAPSIVAFVLTIGADTDYNSLEISYLHSISGTKWSTKSIRSYFTVKKRDVFEGELEKVVPTSMVESLKAELQRISGVKRTTDGESGSNEKKGVLKKRLPQKIRRRSGSNQRKMEW